MTRPMRSLQRYLLLWLAGVLLLVWGVQLVAAWQTGHHEAEEITDGQLIAVARLWLGTSAQSPAGLAPLIAPERVREYVQDVAVMRWVEGQLLTDTHALAKQWPAQLPLGFSVVRLQHAGETDDWRVYQTEQLGPSGVDRLAVLMNMDHRVDLGSDMAEHLMVPSLVLLPLALALLALALRRGLAPLRDLSDDIDGLQGLPGERLHRPHRFTEFESTVRALHGLMDRLEAQRANERAFASDLAHELRTPLAALALQARAVADGAPPEHAKALEAEALRAGAILSQLLALARLESGRAPAATTVGLRACAAQVLSERAQAALDSGHELGLQEGGDEVTVQAQALAVELAVRNLVDNALRHTPAGSRVEVSLLRDMQGCGLQVEDWPASGSPALGGDGLGLGLRLVERLLASQGAALVVAHKPLGGRVATIRWPCPDGVSAPIGVNGG